MLGNMNYILFVMLPGIIIGLWAQWKLHSAYRKYREVPVDSGLTGAEAARRILDNAGLTDMPVEEVEGELTDHYDPTKKALFLSTDNFHGRSVAAVGVAAHEAGHALQHQDAYAMMNLRMALVPVTQFSSTAYGIILLAGFFLGMMKIMLPIVIVLFSIITLFQLITLPVEYDASARQGTAFPPRPRARIRTRRRKQDAPCCRAHLRRRAGGFAADAVVLHQRRPRQSQLICLPPDADPLTFPSSWWPKKSNASRHR